MSNKTIETITSNELVHVTGGAAQPTFRQGAGMINKGLQVEGAAIGRAGQMGHEAYVAQIGNTLLHDANVGAQIGAAAGAVEGAGRGLFNLKGVSTFFHQLAK